MASDTRSTTASATDGGPAAGCAPRRKQPLPGVSVVIPVLNEAPMLPEAIAAARDPDAEIVVVDGGSTDDTVDVARAFGVRVIHAARGRGCQLAAGADAARGELLLFLHADTRLPAGYVQQVRGVMADPRNALGAFRLRIDAPGVGLRVVEWGVRQRCRWLSLPYGDQALFVRAAMYRELGGVRTLPVMEDFDFVRRARHLGRVRTVSAAVLVSPRAWRRHGVLKLTLWNSVSALAFLLGVDPARIARWRTAWRN